MVREEGTLGTPIPIDSDHVPYENAILEVHSRNWIMGKLTPESLSYLTAKTMGFRLRDFPFHQSIGIPTNGGFLK